MNVLPEPPVESLSTPENWLRHVAARSVLQRVTCTFEAHGIAVLPVKGIVTACVLYEDCALRPLGDIDIRISRRDFRRAIQLAEALGWKPRTDAPTLWTATLKLDSWEVDIEGTLGPPGLCALSVDDLLSRAESHVEPLGFEHRRPELNDHALILVINAFKDGLRLLPWAAEDLRRIVCHKRFDPDTLIARARQARLLSALWIVADWLATNHGVSDWRVVCDRLGPEPQNKRVTSFYRFAQGLQWPPKMGLVTIACGSDSDARCVAGLAFAAAGVARRRVLRALTRR